MNIDEVDSFLYELIPSPIITTNIGIINQPSTLTKRIENKGTKFLNNLIMLTSNDAFMDASGMVAASKNVMDEMLTASSSSIFKLANLNFFSTDKLVDSESDNDKVEDNFFLQHCSPSIYLIENSETVTNQNLETTSNSSCRSFFLDEADDTYDEESAYVPENKSDKAEISNGFGKQDSTIVDNISHFRKIFENNVIKVQRSNFFLSLPDLRPVRWLSSQDYFYYSLQDLASLTEFFDSEDDDDVIIDSKTTTNAAAVQIINNLKFFANPKCNSHKVEGVWKDNSHDDDQATVIQDCGSEETTWSHDGPKDIRTKVQLKRNTMNCSWEKTTVVTTFFPDGFSHTDTYYETLFDDDEDEECNMNDIENDNVRRRYEKLYQLQPNQFELIKKCFSRMENNGFICPKILRTHILVRHNL